jgi:hypothetical protein
MCTAWLQYPVGVPPSNNFDDELSVINRTLARIPQEAGAAADNALALCNQTMCTPAASVPGSLICQQPPCLEAASPVMVPHANDQLTRLNAATATGRQEASKNVDGKGAWLNMTTTVAGQITHPGDQDWYQMAVATTEPFTIQLTVHGNWQQALPDKDGHQQLLQWRVSMVRPEVVFVQQGVQVMPAAADPWTW